MAIYQKESLETLRQKVDLVDVLSTYVEFKRTGATFKGLCPFHDEKSPSFIVQRGDTHYHCFGCGAHGDAIQFLMNHQKLKFSDAVEHLASRFHVQLETVDKIEEKGPSKALLKDALMHACQFYHFYLLHTDEGRAALNYLFQRGVDLEFIKIFQIGLSPKQGAMLRKFMHQKKIRDDIMLDAGLIAQGNEGGWRDFFSERIMFPIHNYTGDVIGFSGRKYKEETWGGKYINTQETALFKKSRVLFGLNYSRKRITKERKAIIVEGQMDTLCLIQAGFNITVAGQGTAFGDEHVKELVNLGINQVYLALDSDLAGQEATAKIGHLFQKQGIEARVIELPENSDPDLFLREKGPDAFLDLMNKSIDYLSFLIKHLSKELNLDSPSAKNELIQRAIKLIREWDHPVMVHETLRKLAHSLHIPEDMVGVGKEHVPHVYIKNSGSVGVQTVDPDRILETDLLRWLLILGQDKKQITELVRKNINKDDLKIPVCRKIYETYLKHSESGYSCDLLSLAIDLDDAEGQLVLSDLAYKKINKEKAVELVIETIQKILERNWMQNREEIKVRIHSAQCTDEEVTLLAKQFDDLKRCPPKAVLTNE